MIVFLTVFVTYAIAGMCLFGLGCKDLVGKIVTDCWESERCKSAALAEPAAEAAAVTEPSGL